MRNTKINSFLPFKLEKNSCTFKKILECHHTLLSAHTMIYLTTLMANKNHSKHMTSSRRINLSFFKSTHIELV